MTSKKKPQTGRKNKRAYLDAFRKDGEGAYVYTGELYHYQGRKEELKQELLALWAFCIFSLLAAVGACCISAPGSISCAYILIPCGGGFVFGISVLPCLYRLAAGGDPLRAYVYQASVKRLPGRLMGMAVCAGASVFGEGIYVLRNGMEGRPAGLALFLLLEGAVLAFAILAKGRLDRMEWFPVSSDAGMSSDTEKYLL